MTIKERIETLKLPSGIDYELFELLAKMCAYYKKPVVQLPVLSINEEQKVFYKEIFDLPII